MHRTGSVWATALWAAVCSMGLTLGGAAWAQSVSVRPQAPARGASAEAQLQAIRDALVEKAMSANTRVSATSWLNERGELMEASQFRTDMQVRGVRVLEYMGGEEAKAVVDAAAATPGAQGDQLVCRDPQDGQPWRHPLSLRVQPVAPQDPQVGALVWQATRWLESALRSQAQSEGAMLDTAMAPVPRNRYEEALWSAPQPRSPMVLSVRLRVTSGWAEGMAWARLTRWESRAREWMGWAEGDRQAMTLRLEWSLGRAGEALLLHQVVDVPLTALANQRPGRHWSDDTRALLAQEVGYRWQAIQGMLDCEPLMFEARGLVDGQVMVMAGQDAGLRVGDRLVLVDGRHIPKRLLEADAAPHLALLEVQQVQGQRAQARQVAGPRLTSDAAAQWVAMPYGASLWAARQETLK